MLGNTYTYKLMHSRIRPQSIMWFIIVIIAFTTSFAFVRDLDIGRMIFQVSLFILCTAPYFLMSHEPRLRLLVFFMLIYYAMFGLLDYVLLYTNQNYHIFTVTETLKRTGFCDGVILSGGIALMLSYLTITFLLWRRDVVRDLPIWKYKPSVWFAFVCWVVGIIMQFIVQFVYWTEGPKQINIFYHLVSNLYYLAMAGDIIMIITALNNPRSKIAWFFLAIMIAVEFVFGFFGNTKEVSFRIGIMILISLFFLRGRISLLLVALLVLLFIPYQIAFKIYREKVILIREKSALDAIKNTERSMEIVKKDFEKEEKIEGLFILLDRIDGRKYVEIITQKVGKKAPYKQGETIKLYFYSFIPKILWKEKPQISIGQLMNRTFNISASPKTFVPATQLGEFYWNFGMPGVLVGMAFVGAILALINNIFLSGGQPSTLSMLIIMAAFYFLVMRFESGFASQYNQFTRVMILVGLMGIIFNKFGWTNRLRFTEMSLVELNKKDEERTNDIPITKKQNYITV